MMSLKLIFLMFLIAAFEIDFNDAYGRANYTYIASTDGYYKYQDHLKSWPEARDRCLSEGGFLFHPVNERELREVLSGLGVKKGQWIQVGFSDRETPNIYKTVDGRHISDVYNKWRQGEPDSKFSSHCGQLNVDDYTLAVYPCRDTHRYICKHSQLVAEDQVTAIEEEVKGIIANSSEKVNAVLVTLAEAGTKQATALANLAAAIDRQAVNLASALERMVKAEEDQTAAIDRMSFNLASTIDIDRQNQTAAIEKLTVNLASALERASDRISSNLVAAMKRQEAAAGLQAANQTGFMERQALALEKLASSDTGDEQ